MIFTVFGTGAVGAYYGGKLAKAGNPVNFLVRSDYDVIREKGLMILSPDGDIHIAKPSVYNSPAEVPESDVLIIALKTTGNGDLRKQLEPMVHRNTALLVLQNGLGMEEEISSWFPENPVLGGMCFICARKKAPGVIEHQDKGSVTIGCLSEEDVILRNEITEVFNSADISATAVDDIREARWRKLLWNIPYNGLSVVLNSDTRELMTTASSRKIVEELMLEVLAGAEACRCPIEKEAMVNMLEYTEIMTPYEPSMKLDYLAKRPMETEYMYAKPLQAAAEAGYEMRKVEMLFRQLQFIQDRYI